MIRKRKKRTDTRTGTERNATLKGTGKNLGSKNGQWKGDKVGYRSLHWWVTRNKPKPQGCEICKQNKKLEVANISGKYKRDLSDWEYLCRSCHMRKDGRLSNLKQFSGTIIYDSKRELTNSEQPVINKL